MNTNQPRVIKAIGKGLGYAQWLQVDRTTNSTTLLHDGQVANIHPVIIAAEYHAANLDCNVGDLICGVRWYSV